MCQLKEFKLNVTKVPTLGTNPISTEIPSPLLSIVGQKRPFFISDAMSLKKFKPDNLTNKLLIEEIRSPTRSIEKILKILNSGESDIINQQEELLGNTPLHFATFHNLFSIVKILVNHKANLNIKNNHGVTPLMSAVEKGFTAIAKFLLISGSDTTITDTQGFSVLHKAVINGNLEITRAVLEQNHSHLFINTRSTQGLTALHQAAYHGNLSAVQLLCSYSADVNVNSFTNITPLHMAASRNQPQTVKTLISNSAEVDCQDAHLRSPLHYACIFGHFDVAKELLSCGANEGKLDMNNQSPLSIANQDCNEEIISLINSTSAKRFSDYFPGEET